MKKQTAIAITDTGKPAPAYDRLASIPVTPRRHEGTARTVCRVQPDGEQSHLFSYAGDFIATVPSADAAPFLSKGHGARNEEPATAPTPRAIPTPADAPAPLVLSPANVVLGD